MKELVNGGRLVESVDELPDLRNAHDLFADFETTSGNDKEDSLNPWHDCWAAGIAVTVDDASGAWYIPVRHRSGGNLPLDNVRAWWHDTLGSAKCWSNHNVKYDAHVSANDLGWCPDWPEQDLYCTVVQSKIVDSDRQAKGGYGLDALSRDWLGDDIGHYEQEIKRWLSDSKDYGKIPAAVMAPYACQDVLTTRRLKKYCEQRRHPDCSLVSRMEVDMTSVLLQIERNGMQVNRIELMKTELAMSLRILEIDEELRELTGRSVNPSSPDQLYDLFINQYGLPIVGWTEEDEDGNPAGNPSFDKEALAIYAMHPLAPRRVVALIQEAKSLTQTLGLFVKPYQILCDDLQRIHPLFNQMVRTGRLSCSKPNLQQCSKIAKALIHPGPGNAILTFDQSQIEFRVIVHYIENQRCIEAYAKDPDTDFHMWMAEMAGMKRKPAKTLNFQMGYGGGKKKAVKSLSMNADVVGAIKDRIDELVRLGTVAEQNRQATYEALCKSTAEGVYNDYHRALPELKPTSRRATAVCYDRGYVRNVHGRHRHLPQKAAHKAFNSLCQGEAADIQKERTIAAARACLNTPIMIVGNVHDETPFEGPAEVMEDPRTQAALAYLMETPNIPLRVPLRCSVGCSRESWADASTEVDKGGKSAPLKYDRNLINKDDPLCHLR